MAMLIITRWYYRPEALGRLRHALVSQRCLEAAPCLRGVTWEDLTSNREILAEIVQGKMMKIYENHVFSWQEIHVVK